MLLQAPPWARATPRSAVELCATNARDISRVLVCVGHLCECQEAGGGARALLKDLRQSTLQAPIEETPCLGMCGMGAMGCVEYADGAETLTHGRDQMLEELGVTARDVECPVDAVESTISRVLVCTGRPCQRQQGGGTELLNALRKAAPQPELLEASPCLGGCGQGGLVCIEYADGCEETIVGLQPTLTKLGR
jgi:hypothetical protein